MDIPDTGGHGRTSIFGKFDASTVEIFIRGGRGHNSQSLVHQGFFNNPQGSIPQGDSDSPARTSQRSNQRAARLFNVSR